MSTGARLGTKRSLAPPSPSPSVGSTASAAAGGTTPRKDRDTPGASGSHPIVYSQPQLTGTGTNTVSQMSYAVTWLRTKEEPQTYMDVLGYLSGTNWPESAQENFVELMRLNPRIQWTPDPTLSEQTWRTGTYMHRPTIPNVRNKTQLLAYLQKKTDASGVDVKDLKDGWPNCDAALSELEAAHKILVVRAKKDGVAKRVWPDDPSLFHEIDPELKLMWAKTDVPAPDSIVQRLKAAGQKPMSEDPRDKVLAAPKVEKKKRATRKTGKLTNTHMNKLFKDYSNQ
ncbi:1e60ec1f-fb16-4d6f-a6f1-dad0f04b8cd0 [Echria macrotheca]|uniref:Transcription initiation factor IIE subunit beta n=1 Tax=Echria macrotheca TaxID=438768 RepID=A0AAJ0BEN1_9PEZI|nr:1e60ec1f-fb16-4d6f-a6f1-dad0f04b8cd0 [Echria macrotheca]